MLRFPVKIALLFVLHRGMWVGAVRSDGTSKQRMGKHSEDLVTTYVAIFTVHPMTKQQTLYRHFLRFVHLLLANHD